MVFTQFTRIFLLAIAFVTLLGCGEGPFSDYFPGDRKDCHISMKVENQSQASLLARVSMSERTHDARCEGPQWSESEKALAPGESRRIKATLRCQYCDLLHYSYSTFTNDGARTTLYDNSSDVSIGQNVLCTDSGCSSQ